MDRIPRRSRNQHRITPTLVFIATLTMAGCATYRGVGGDTVTPSSELRIRFTPPREVVAVSPTGDSMTVTGVVELRGKVVERSDGMITLEASRASTVDSRAVQRFGRGAVVRVPVQDVELRELNRGRTTLLVVGLISAALLLLLAATYDSEPSPPAPKQQESTKY